MAAEILFIYLSVFIYLLLLLLFFFFWGGGGAVAISLTQTILSTALCNQHSESCLLKMVFDILEISYDLFVYLVTSDWSCVRVPIQTSSQSSVMRLSSCTSTSTCPTSRGSCWDRRPHQRPQAVLQQVHGVVVLLPLLLLAHFPALFHTCHVPH